MLLSQHLNRYYRSYRKSKRKTYSITLLGTTVLPLLSEEGTVSFTEEDYKQAYKEQAAKLSRSKIVDTAEAMPTRDDPEALICFMQIRWFS